METTQRRAIGIVRVSQVQGRDKKGGKGERFASPDEQRQRIEDACARDGLRLVEVHEELDVSGGRALADRPGLSKAVAAIEAAEADVVVAAYFDRLFRSLATQAEDIDRVEIAGGRVLAVDVGEVSNGSAGQWLSGAMLGAVSEYYRRSIRERSREGQIRAIARGVLPAARVPLGYLRRKDGILEVDPETAPLVVRMFEMRAEGLSPFRIRDLFLEHGITRSYNGIRALLKNRVYLGEVHFGKLVNLNAHEAIIGRDLFDRAGRATTPRGPAPPSDALLARTRVLVCGTCGGLMGPGVVKVRNKAPFRVYQCRAHTGCSCKVAIGARIAEEAITNAVRDALQDAQGRASMAQNAQQAAGALRKAQDELDGALRVFALTGAENESAAVERVGDLRQARDDAQAHLDQIGPKAARTVNAAADWEDLSLSERRNLIRATVRSAVIAPGGRGAERIRLNLFG